ncbi:MFS general substrate transporter [Daldinia caldariorum]|uniref:MFS general substrate transporter n=1 Tax=Daldinia caldariorum TaxID=326644 RepID=UPI00200786B3|nr:MFS general substrate transporter [Daldinia caldariorum]KAI1463560.1 MFS general substrate transporter [Daldinia caldariorum]
MPPLSSSSSSSSQGELPADVEKQAIPIPAGAEGPSESRKNQGEVEEGGGGTGNMDSPAEEGEDWRIPPEPDILNPDADGVAGVVSRVLSRMSTKSSWNPGPPPDGGKVAWLMCICGHLAIMNTWGFINSFGVFQAYYVAQLGRPPSDISWIGSVQVFLTFFVGTFAGRFTDAGFFRPVTACGVALMTLGIFATSAATRYWQLVLSQGLCMGLGSGCVFCPTVATVSTYFRRRRSLAIGLAASGSVTGGLVFPAMARQLLPAAGFGWTVRAMGFVQLATLALAMALMRSRLPPRRAGSLVEWAAFREPEYALYAAGMFFSFWGVYFGFYYLAAFARAGTAISPAMSYTDSLDLLLVVNGVGLVGRIVPNYFADRVGPLNLMIPACLGCGAAVLAWMAVRTPAQLYGWAVAYGVVAGAIQSLFPAGLSSLTTDLRKQGTRMGMTFTIVSFAVLTGNPIAGAIIGRMDRRYVGAQGFTGASLLVGAVLLFGARWARMRRTGRGWKTKI